MSLKNKFLASILYEFIEFCFKNAECSLYPEDFYGKEKKIIDDFLKNRDAEFNMEWISVKDKAPPADIWILGANKYRVEFGIWLGEKKGFTLPQCNYLCLGITHWMPLPEPPKNND